MQVKLQRGFNMHIPYLTTPNLQVSVRGKGVACRSWGKTCSLVSFAKTISTFSQTFPHPRKLSLLICASQDWVHTLTTNICVIKEKPCAHSLQCSFNKTKQTKKPTNVAWNFNKSLWLLSDSPETWCFLRGWTSQVCDKGVYYCDTDVMFMFFALIICLWCCRWNSTSHRDWAWLFTSCNPPN